MIRVTYNIYEEITNIKAEDKLSAFPPTNGIGANSCCFLFRQQIVKFRLVLTWTFVFASLGIKINQVLQQVTTFAFCLHWSHPLGQS